jgi:hypothetical protein
MSPVYYRLLIASAISVSLTLSGCGGKPPEPAAASPEPPKFASNTTDELGTDATLWTVLGLAKKPSHVDPGPATGATVSPVLWQAVHDTLDFVRTVSEDPITGALVTDWYSPDGKPNERLRATVFILARALRSDSIAVTVDRQERSKDGRWVDSTIDRQTDDALASAILTRARQIRQERAAAAAEEE